MSTSGGGGLKYYIHSAELRDADDTAFDNVLLPLVWLSIYTNLDYELWKKWMQAVYTNGQQYNILHVVCQNATDSEKHYLIVYLDKNTWRLVNEMPERDIMFDAFHLFTAQT
jgi:hypothetical protein